ncbi:hypothetical protein ISCGN_014378 [Ixodes scapularis]
MVPFQPPRSVGDSKQAGEPSKSQPHHPAFSREIVKELVPLYNRLSKTSRKELLERCAGMKTQNANESYNALVWRRCPKDGLCVPENGRNSYRPSSARIYLGPTGFESALLEMGIEPGRHQVQHSSKALQAKISKAKQKALQSSKMAQKQSKLQAIAKQQKDQEAEGPTYAAGAF